MHPNWKFAVLPLMLGAALLACAGSDDEKGSLEVTVSQTRLNGEGQSTDLYITAIDETGKAGTGTVTLTTKTGDLSAAGGLEAKVDLQEGKASTSYSCTRAPGNADAGVPAKECKGTVSIRAEWNGVKDSVGVTFPKLDAGTPGGDGGTDAGL
ncbi:hypothetical protein [Melittangium boletus]|uniref:Lipoprotein n=1 Tax=Melittangium boletus DSM 14713 TaxID=1294270 RepID=A0A250IAD4_9BACT|nr:hypothetical protein [Melittangium boletus]ATB28170.1 hypothetical protein MEBOL_001616 [Melittangium boletus DSM 14713]